MDYILLCDYTPFKTGQRVRLPDRTAEKLLSEGVVQRADVPLPEMKKPWRWDVDEKIVPTPAPSSNIPDEVEQAIIGQIVHKRPTEKKKGHGRKK